MRSVHAFIAAAAMLQADFAAGETTGSERCLSCRAVAPFDTCRKPMEGYQVFGVRVEAIEKAQCSQVLVLSLSDQPHQTIKVDLGSCAYFAGKAGDVIEVATQPLLQNLFGSSATHSLACRLW